MAARTFLCDFDGTISPHDVGAAFLSAFAPDGEDERRALIAAWRRGEIGSREVTERECEMARADAAAAHAFVSRYRIDPHFVEFVAAARARGDEVQVVSDGFEFYVAQLLEAARLGDLPRSANRLRFEGDRLVPEFPNAGAGCGRCGNCKGAHARRAKADGRIVVVVGDGLSDRCAAREADHVLARGDLLEWCVEQGVASGSFEDFADVARWAANGEGS